MAEKYQRLLTAIKNILFIDSGLLVNFWAKTNNTSNYLQNKFLTKYSKHIVIQEEACTRKREDI